MTDQQQQLRDRYAIIELCTRMAWHLDHCEWDQLVDLFTDEIRLDYTSLNGGEPVTLPRKDVIGKWRSNREGLQATQHLLSNHLVTVDGATAHTTAMFQATHLLPNPFGGPTWTLGGEYRYGLMRTADGWRISALTMNILWADGNRHIRDLALQDG
ncbi:nuclear transport factor 2 family protein [Streptomyces anthocyanicus]|uniref:nuclear transport factor 2 family protein n=1 Tax=Streptomyces anthocyanicus TaxID=68174 RepID=UPI002DDB8D19|nr:nuclear transport factor 2 family protein [Streptomyces anthocyanicus]WSB66352.1 nuclear transport factor 2 family protein [Streptomyces anthocyanicus]